jgi:hypothetical protein
MIFRPGVVCCDIECSGELSFIRADGNCECRDCGRLYYDHPHCKNSEIPEHWRSTTRPEFVLRVLCDGTHVKL